MSSGVYIGLSTGNVGIGTTGLTNVASTLNVNGDIAATPLVGQVSFFAMNTAPTGWLKCNGATVSRTTYAKLFAVIGTTYGAGNGTTTFSLPDLRGEFMRGWDDSRGIDSGRGFASAQLDAFQGHKHSISNNTGRDGGGGSTDRGSGTFTWGQAVVGNPTTDGANGAPRSDNETRPRNVALLACIKY